MRQKETRANCAGSLVSCIEVGHHGRNMNMSAVVPCAKGVSNLSRDTEHESNEKGFEETRRRRTNAASSALMVRVKAGTRTGM